MKTIKNYLLLVLSALLVFSACDEREFDRPPINEPKYEGEANWTIKELKDTYGSEALIEIDRDSIIRGIITANDISGNIYKQIQIQDETGGICIAIDQNNINNDLRVGQEVFIELKGLYFGLYGGSPQIGYKYSKNNDGNYTIGQCPWVILKEHLFLNEWPDAKKVEIPTVSLDTLSAAHPLVGTVVTLKDVYFEKGGMETFSEASTTGGVQTLSKNLYSSSGVVIVARNSSAADFAGKTMPKGVGTVTGVLSRYNSTLQITFRSYEDCSEDRFEGAQGTGTKNDPWSVKYTLNNQDSEKNGWIQGYVVGTVAPGINEENPIKSNSDILWEPDFLNNSVVIAAEADVKDWEKVVVINLPAGSDIRTQVNLMDTPDNLGKLLKVKGDLKKSFGAAGLSVANGNADEFEFAAEVKPGDGTEENPYKVSEVMLKQGAKDNTNYLWATGYVVGIWENKDAAGNDLHPNSFAKFEPPFYNNVNLLLADSPEAASQAVTVCVQIPAGMRDVLSPANNANILKQKIYVRGGFEKYNGLPGIKNLQAYKLEGEGPGPEPGNYILDVPFTDGQMGGFTSYNVSGDQVWNFHATNPSYGIMMSGFTTKSNANEDWLFSPALDLTGKTKAVLSFEHTINKGDLNNLKTNHTLWLSTDYVSGAPTTATWTQVTITTYPTGSDWNFVNTGDIALPASVLGKANVHFALKYLCSDAESASWQVRNLKLSEEGGSGSTDPEPEPGDGPGSSSSEPYSVADAIKNQGNGKITWTKGYIVGCVKKDVKTITSAADVTIGVSSGWDNNTNVLIADSANETDYTKCVIVNLPSNKALRNQANLVDNAGSYKKSLTVKGTLRTYFGSHGLRDCLGAEGVDFILD